MLKVGNLEVYGIIYVIRNKRNNKLYIGQTTQKRGFKDRYCGKGCGIERVLNHYESYKKSGDSYNEYLYKAIKKYGMSAFDVDELFDYAFTQDELNKLEEMYIKIYKTTNPKYGYNFVQGGNNRKANVNSKTKDGVYIKCMNDGKIYRSKTDASKAYNVTVNYINSTLKVRRVLEVKSRIENGEFIFRKVKEDKIKNKGFCVMCECVLDKTNPRQKYCKECAKKENSRRAAERRKLKSNIK